MNETPQARLLEISVLRNRATSNPNRGKNGEPKSAHFGGVPRSRISSQCMKRAIRFSEEFRNRLAGQLADRTRYLPEIVRKELAKTDIPAEEHERIVQASAKIANKKDDSEQKPATAGRGVQTPQLIFLEPSFVPAYVQRLVESRKQWPECYEYYLNPATSFQSMVAAKVTEENSKLPENAWAIARHRMPQLAELAKFEGQPPQNSENPGEEEADWIVEQYELLSDKDKKVITKKSAKEDNGKKKEPADYKKFQKSLAVAYDHSAVDIGLFGRMTTSEILTDVEACVSVAHAIGVNEMTLDQDYFTAVDDLGSDYGEDRGAGFVAEDNYLTSNTYYEYYCIDLQALWKQRSYGRDAEQTAAAVRDAVSAFMHAVATANPRGKKNSTAAYNLPAAMLVEIKPRNIQTNLMDAFLTPVRPTRNHNIVQGAVKALGQHVGQLHESYPTGSRLLWHSVNREPLSYINADNQPVTLAENQKNFPALIEATADLVVQ